MIELQLFFFFQPPGIDSASTAGLQPYDIEGNVEFDNVFFDYPSRPDVPVSPAINSLQHLLEHDYTKLNILRGNC